MRQVRTLLSGGVDYHLGNQRKDLDSRIELEEIKEDLK